MAMSTSEIGTVLFVVTGLLVLVQIPVLAAVIKLLGARLTFCLSALIQAILIPLLPVISTIEDRVTLWVLLCTHSFVVWLLMMASFLSVNVLINNSIGSQLNATANAIGYTCAALGRILSPLVFAPLYSWSLTNGISSKKETFLHGFPWNHYFAFLVWALVLVIISCLGTMVSKNADKKLGVHKSVQ